MAYLYHSISPFAVHLPQSLLYRNESIKGLQSGRAVGIFSYQGHVPSFKVLLDDGSIWDFCLPSYLQTADTSVKGIYSLNDLVYNNCPSYNFAVYYEPELATQRLDVFFKRKNCWAYEAQYLLTIDWMTCNQSANLVKLTNGQVAFVPNHKMLLRTPQNALSVKLPPYRAFKDVGKI